MTIRVQEHRNSCFLFGEQKKWVYVHPDHLLAGLADYLEQLQRSLGRGVEYEPWRKVERLLQERLAHGNPAKWPKKEIQTWQKLVKHAAKISDLFIWLKMPELVLDESD